MEAEHVEAVDDLHPRDSDQLQPLPRDGQHRPAPGAQHHQAALQQSQAEDGSSLLICNKYHNLVDG